MRGPAADPFAFNSDKRNRDLASRDLLHQFGGCQVGKIVPTYVIDRNDRLAVVSRHEQECGLHFANNARVEAWAQTSGRQAITVGGDPPGRGGGAAGALGALHCEPRNGGRRRRVHGVGRTQFLCQPAESLPLVFRYSEAKKPGRETTPGQVNNNRLLPERVAGGRGGVRRAV